MQGRWREAAARLEQARGKPIEQCFDPLEALADGDLFPEQWLQLGANQKYRPRTAAPKPGSPSREIRAIARTEPADPFPAGPGCDCPGD